MLRSLAHHRTRRRGLDARVLPPLLELAVEDVLCLVGGRLRRERHHDRLGTRARPAAEVLCVEALLELLHDDDTLGCARLADDERVLLRLEQDIKEPRVAD